MIRRGASGGRSRWLALAVLCAGQLMIVLDGTIVAVALPSIQRSLGFSQSSLAWVVNAYLIAFGGVLLLAGRLGDLIGRKRMFVIGLAVFTGASVLCGTSTSQAMLIASRFVQGVGGAIAAAVVLGMIMMIFPGQRELAGAIGVSSFVAAAGGTVGSIAGGVLTQAISWHWIFFINVPVGAAATLLAARLLIADRGIGVAAGADVVGAALVTAGLMVGVYTIVEAAGRGWDSAHTLGFGALSIALLVAFVARQATAPRPLLPLRMFRSRNLSGANLVQVLMVAGLTGFQFLGVLYLQRVLGLSPGTTGLAAVPVALVMGAVSLGLSARLITRFGARSVLLPGLVLLAAALALLARAPADGHYVTDVLPAMLLIGAGAGLAMPSLMGTAMSSATPADAGLVSGLVTTSAQAGSALGLAVLATLATTRSNHLRADGQPLPVALTGGYHLAFAVAAGLVTVGAILAAVILRPRARPAPLQHDQPATAGSGERSGLPVPSPPPT